MHIIRDEARYTPRLVVVVGTFGSVLGVLVIYYLGLFSAAAAMLTVAIYFFGMSSNSAAARGVYGTIAGLYLIITVAIALRFVPDHSLFSVEQVPTMSRWYRVLMMQVVFGLTFYLARSSRRAMTDAIAGAKQMRSELKQRDAQLVEAKTELDWALRTGEGQMTGQDRRRVRVGAAPRSGRHGRSVFGHTRTYPAEGRSEAAASEHGGKLRVRAALHAGSAGRRQPCPPSTSRRSTSSASHPMAGRSSRWSSWRATT